MDLLLYEEKNSFAYITLNRPQIHNAFDDHLIDQLKNQCRSMANNEALRGMVLQAEGKSFSAGADLNWMKKMRNYSLEENLSDAYKLADMVESLFSCPLPTIARVQGNAFGGGVGLLSACDFVVALEGAKFGFTEVRLGLAPACISRPVIFRIGPKKARQLFLTGEIFGAFEAHQMGLVDHLASSEEEMDQKIQGIISHLLACSPKAQKASKELTDKIGQLAAPEAREVGARTIAELRVSSEGQEGLSAFLDKRKPSWYQS